MRFIQKNRPLNAYRRNCSIHVKPFKEELPTQNDMIQRRVCLHSLLRPGKIFGLILLSSLLVAGLSPAAHAQGESRIQAGFGLVPGVGVYGGYLSAHSIYTTEASVYADAAPQFLGGEGSVLVSLGLGGAIRPLGFIRMIGNASATSYDIDVGLRIGPALFFAFNETKSTKNQRFNLFLEPFIRLTSQLARGNTFFVEAGIQRPLFRAGLWFSI